MVIDLQRLAAIGEWAALGFYEAADHPWPIPYGVALRRLYENMPVVVPEAGLLTPCEPLGGSRTRQSHGAWSATAFILDLNHHQGLRVNQEIAAAKQERFPEQAAFIDALVADLRPRLPHFGGYTHSNPDIERVVQVGFVEIEAELDRELAAVAANPAADPGERHLLAALKEYAEGVKAFHRRTAAALRDAVDQAEGDRRRQLATLADAFAHAFLHPAENFLQGLLAVNFAWMLDGCDSIGRVDQALGGLWERDRAAGRLDLELARQLLDEWFAAFERLNGWNLQIGGYTRDRRDGCNELTLELLDACRRNHFRRPNVAFRLTRHTPETALDQAIEALAGGAGRPALYNDERYVEALLRLPLGLTPEDAGEIGFGGCTETMIAGRSNCGSLEGSLNLAKALELALFDGWDPVAGRQAGPHTGQFADFATADAFEAAVRRQIQYQTDSFVSRLNGELRQRFTQGDPKLYRTLFTRDCVKRHRSFEAGGARYNWSVVSYQGIANLIDSLAAIRHCVYDQPTIAATELVNALRHNFAGRETLRRQLLAAPKFGNDDDAVDQPGAAILRYAWETLLAHEPPRGGRYLPSCILFTTYYGAGLQVGATPDGRRAGEVLTDSVGAVQGRDTTGPTALLNSVAKLPLELAVGTPVLNVRFAKPMLAEAAGRRQVAALVRAFFERGGLQIQLSALDREELLAAQQEPEKHGDLIVRIGGYSEYFVILDRQLQDSVIARTEYGR